MQNNDSPHILELLSFTETHNRHIEDLARATGEHFNIFKILGIGRREVTTHSPVLAELLNPKGNHSQGAAFLRLFLDKFNIAGFDAETATVATEYYIGPVNEAEETGGRIDILIKDSKGKMILIENKIDAVDQPNQMMRYFNFARRTLSQFDLFYLTLDGHKPSNSSEEDLNCVKCITYKTEILTWLKDCRKETACLPNVRENITQYIHLIEELTNQSTTILMNKDLIEKIVGSKDTLHAFHTLHSAVGTVHTELITRMLAKMDKLAKENGLEPESHPELNGADVDFCFATKGLLQNNLRICFGFDKGSYNGFFFGFYNNKAPQPCPVSSALLAAFSKQFPTYSPCGSGNYDPGPYYPAYAYWEYPYKDWYPDTFEASDSVQFEDSLNAKLKILVDIAKQVCPDATVT